MARGHHKNPTINQKVDSMHIIHNENSQSQLCFQEGNNQIVMFSRTRERREPTCDRYIYRVVFLLRPRSAYKDIFIAVFGHSRFSYLENKSKSFVEERAVNVGKG